MIRFLAAFSAVAVGLGAARALTTAYVPVLLDEIEHNPGLIGAVMLVNAVAGFAVPLGAGLVERPARSPARRSSSAACSSPAAGSPRSRSAPPARTSRSRSPPRRSTSG